MMAITPSAAPLVAPLFFALHIGFGCLIAVTFFALHIAFVSHFLLCAHPDPMYPNGNHCWRAWVAGTPTQCAQGSSLHTRGYPPVGGSKLVRDSRIVRRPNIIHQAARSNAGTQKYIGGGLSEFILIPRSGQGPNIVTMDDVLIEFNICEPAAGMYKSWG